MNNKDKKKKKITPVIVKKPEIMTDVKPVQSSHFEPSVTPSYYPAGQRKLRDKGLEYNYDNFIRIFGDDIKDKDLEILKSSDKTRIKDNMNKNEWMQSFLAILYYLLLVVLVGSGYNLYNIIITNFSTENNKIIVNNIWHILISGIIFIVIFYVTWKVKKEEIISKKTSEAGNLKLKQ